MLPARGWKLDAEIYCCHLHRLLFPCPCAGGNDKRDDDTDAGDDDQYFKNREFPTHAITPNRSGVLDPIAPRLASGLVDVNRGHEPT